MSSAALGSCFEFARLSFLELVTYRLRYYIGVVTYLVHVAVYWFVWEAVYQGGHQFGGLSLAEMTTYIAVGWAARSFYYNNVDWDIYEQVSQGRVALDLLKPIDFQYMHLARAVGESLFRLALFTVPSAIAICLVFSVEPPASTQAFLGFAITTFLGLLINVNLNFLIGLLAFRIRSVVGIMRAKYVAMQLLTGLIIPISFYPEFLQRIFYLTPFPYIANVPLLVYLGKSSGTQLAEALAVQLLWALGLYALGRWVWKRSLRYLVIQGG